MAGGWESLGLLPELVQACEEDFNWILPSDVRVLLATPMVVDLEHLPNVSSVYSLPQQIHVFSSSLQIQDEAIPLLLAGCDVMVSFFTII